MFISKKMRYFMVIMEKRNFSRAAEALCITRSPLSKMISEIELLLADKLFIRKHNDLEPTFLAWEMYYKCKPLYDKLLTLESNYSRHHDEYLPELYFDVTVPENLFKTLKMILSSEELNISCKRDLLSYDEIITLKDMRRKWVISFRDLGSCAGVHKEQWEGGELVLLRSHEQCKDTRRLPPIYIWKENYTEFLKERFLYAIDDVTTNLDFIEHNYDMSTLFYLVRTGKGMALSSRKLATMYKLDGVSILPLKKYHPKFYLYSNMSSESDVRLMRFKDLLNKFV